MNTWPKKDMEGDLIEWSDLVSSENRLRHKEFMELYMGNFEPASRNNNLYERLQQYYKDTPVSMSNKEAFKYYKEFRSWCVENGYNNSDISNIKRQYKFNGS